MKRNKAEKQIEDGFDRATPARDDLQKIEARIDWDEVDGRRGAHLSRLRRPVLIAASISLTAVFVVGSILLWRGIAANQNYKGWTDESVIPGNYLIDSADGNDGLSYSEAKAKVLTDKAPSGSAFTLLGPKGEFAGVVEFENCTIASFGEVSLTHGDSNYQGSVSHDGSAYVFTISFYQTAGANTFSIRSMKDSAYYSLAYFTKQ